MQTHIKVLGVLNLIFGVLGLLGSLAVMMGFGLLGAAIGSSGDPDAATGATVMGLVGTIGSAFIGVTAALSLVCGWGLLNYKPWARILAIIVCALSLISFPIGTIFGIYGLWVLFNKETEALFKSAGPQPAV